MKLWKRYTSILICFVLAVPLIASASYEGGIPKDWDLSKAQSASITLAHTAISNKMELIDGGETDISAVTANKRAVYGGRECREVFVANKLSFKLDDSFAAEGDDIFLFEFEYWDYAGAGMFYLDFASEDSQTEGTRINIYKRGSPSLAAQWRKEAVLVSGAKFNHSLSFGADFQIANRANNAFAKVTVYNLSPIVDELTMDLGVHNEETALKLYHLGLLEAADTAAVSASLNEPLTKEQAVKRILQGFGLGSEALGSDLSCPYQDVSEEYRPYAALAKKLGLLTEATGTLGAQEVITQKELITLYLNYFGLIVTEGNVLKTAKEHKLIRSTNCIFQMNQKAKLDHLVALSYNSLKLNDPETKELMITSLLQKKVISLDSIIKSKDKELYNEFFKKPVYCEPVKVVDDLTGRTWHYLDFFGVSIMRSYFTQRSWTMDNERFIFSDYNKFVYEYNTKTYMVKKIGEYFGTYVAMSMAPKSNNFYFINPKKQIIKMDMDTYKETVVVQLPDGVYQATDIGVSNNEKMISLDCFIHVDGIPTDNRSAYYNVETGELNLSIWRDFTKVDGEGYYGMHASINPVYTDLLLYCCGGSYTGPKPYRTYTRIWLHNIATGEDYNFFKQYQIGYHPRGINYGEENCHETWTCDGENLVINKARAALEGVDIYVGIPGIVLLDKNGRDRNYVGCPKITIDGATYELYLTHPGVSSVDPRWVISDTGVFNFSKGHCPIFLIDVQSGKTLPVVNPPNNGYSDFHPHPSTSQDGNIVIFGTTSETGIGRIGWMDISDLVSVPQNGQRVSLSSSCEALDYAEFEYDLEQEMYDGKPAFHIGDGKKMYINVDNDVVWGVKKDVTLSVTYLDEGLLPMKLEYYVWMDNLLTNRLEKKTYYIQRGNTKKWKTENITLKGINLDNMELLATDMKLSGVGSSAVIKEVAAKEYTKE